LQRLLRRRTARKPVEVKKGRPTKKVSELKKQKSEIKPKLKTQPVIKKKSAATSAKEATQIADKLAELQSRMDKATRKKYHDRIMNATDVIKESKKVIKELEDTPAPWESRSKKTKVSTVGKESGPKKKTTGKSVVENIKQQLNKERKRRTSFSGDKIPYLKLGHKNRFRILVPPGGEGLYKIVKVHTYMGDGGRLQSSLDMDFHFADAAEAKYVLTHGPFVDKADYRAWKQMGDPINALAKALKEVGRKKEAANFWSRTTYLFNVLNRADGKVYVWQATKTNFDKIMELVFPPEEDDEEIGLAVAPELFDPIKGNDIIIKSNGEEGKARRYPKLLRAKPSPVGDYDGELYDLNLVMAKKATHFNNKVDVVFNTYGKQARRAGLDEDAWQAAAPERSKDTDFNPDELEGEDE
jgi:hypothetical protein